MDEPRTYSVDAERFARAWLAVATAASTEPEMVVLYRTVAIELWPRGVRLTSMDNYILWTAWVPQSEEDDPSKWPAMDELPDESPILAYDEDHRARDLLRFALRTVTAKDACAQRLTLHIGPTPPQPGQLTGLEPVSVSFGFPAETPIGEQVTIGTIDAGFPEWRPLLGRPKRATSRLVLSPDLLHQFVQARRWVPAVSGYEWQTAGEKGAVIVTVNAGNPDLALPEMCGAIMPVNAPKGDPDAERLQGVSQ